LGELFRPFDSAATNRWDANPAGGRACHVTSTKDADISQTEMNRLLVDYSAAR